MRHFIVTGNDFRFIVERYGVSLRTLSLQTQRSEKYYAVLIHRYGDKPLPIKHLDALEKVIGAKNLNKILSEVAENKTKHKEQTEEVKKSGVKLSSGRRSASTSPMTAYDEGTIIDENGVPVAAWSYKKTRKGKRKPITKPFDFGLTDEEIEAKVDFGDLV